MTRASIFARRWVAGNILVLAILASISARAHASANETRLVKIVRLPSVPRERG